MGNAAIPHLVADALAEHQLALPPVGKETAQLEPHYLHGVANGLVVSKLWLQHILKNTHL